MDLRLHSRRPAIRAPDWIAAAVAGFVAGAVLMVLEMLWADTQTDMTPWTISHMIAGIVTGPATIQSHEFSLGIVASALVTHYVLGIIYSMILAALVATIDTDGSASMALFIGAAFGLLLYAFNFYGMTYFFPWFEALRGGPAVLAHVIFGMVAAGMYNYLE